MMMQKKRTGDANPLDRLVTHLLHRAVQRADLLFAEEVAQPDLTSRQFGVLLAVAHSDGPSQTDLVETTGIDRSTLADLVRRLVKKGLLQRRRRREDARAYLVRLTDAGREMIKSVQPKALHANTALLARLTGEAAKDFRGSAQGDQHFMTGGGGHGYWMTSSRILEGQVTHSGCAAAHGFWLDGSARSAPLSAHAEHIESDLPLVAAEPAPPRRVCRV